MDTLQPLPRAAVCNVHGVREEFLHIGWRMGWLAHAFGFHKGAYFIGKVLWAKGHRLLLDYLAGEEGAGVERTAVDVFGDGDDLAQVQATAAEWWACSPSSDLNTAPEEISSSFNSA